jgi:hypothetical protein
MLVFLALAGLLGSGQPDTARARELMYREDYLAAEAEVLAARAAAPDDLDTYELRTTLVILRIARAMADARKKPDDFLSRCDWCEGSLASFDRDRQEGIRLADRRISEHPDDEHALYVRARLDLNWTWLQKGVLDRRRGLETFRNGRDMLRRILARNPRHIRSLIALAEIEHVLARQNLPTRIFMRPFIGSGNREEGYRQIALAIALSPKGSVEEAEAKFALWDMLSEDRRFREASAQAAELKTRFAENSTLEKFLREHPPAKCCENK